MIEITAASRDDVHHSAGRGAILRREGILQDGHLLNCELRQIGEYRLPAPAIGSGTSVHHKGGLPASRFIGREEILVDEHIPLIQRRAVRRIKQREEGDPPIQQWYLLNLCCVQTITELWLVCPD